MQITGAYSISGRDLRALFQLLRKDPDGQVSPLSRWVLCTLWVPWVGPNLVC